MSQNNQGKLEGFFKFLFKIEIVIILYLVVAGIIIWFLLDFFDIEILGINILKNDSSEISLSNKIEISKTIATILGGLAVFLNIYYTGKQKESLEKSALAAIQNAKAAEEKQITERYSKAVEMLGNKEEIYVRIGAIFALERIAKDSDKDYGQIIEILTAYITEKSLDKSEIGCLKLDIQSALKVIIRLRENYNLDEEYIIDITKANLKYTNFKYANLVFLNLKEVNFSFANLEGANLQGVNLEKANFSFANLEGANLQNVNMKYADFSYTNLKGVDFQNANLEGVNLLGANLEGANLNKSILKQVNNHCEYEPYDEYEDTIFMNDEDNNYFMNFSDANLKDADLKYANLEYAIDITLEQIKSAKNWEKSRFPYYIKEKLGMLDNEANNF
ncbi:MAG TPA: pentapeptide repeat-containing protein [Nostocaceae cyanobacterium]|nr:pentapeptide repeat-containing protein [Nostocaceae cyanobacterium]